MSVVLCGCEAESEPEQSSETEPTTQSVTAAPTTVAPTTTLPATVDNPKKTLKSVNYDYVAIKKKSGEIISQFDKIIDDSDKILVYYDINNLQMDLNEIKFVIDSSSID